MLGWLLWAAASVAAAEPVEVSWATMQEGARIVAPLLPSKVRWERAPESHTVDLLEPITGSRVVVGLLDISVEGIPVPAALQLWDARTGDPRWSAPRPWVEGAVWEVVLEEPLVVAGRGPTSSVILVLDPATGETLWSTSSEHSLVQVVGESIVVWRRGRLEALAVRSGDTLWTVPMQPPAALHMRDGAIIVEGADAVLSIDANWGAEDWRVPGAWSVAPSTDGRHVALFQSQELRWLDAFGQSLWAWAPDPSGDGPTGRLVAAAGADGHAVAVLSSRSGDRAVVLSEGQVIGTVLLNGHLASAVLAIHGVLALTTEDELIAFSPVDGTVAFRSALPEPFLGWGPDDRPALPHGQLDMLYEYEEQVVVVRERAGIATYEAAHFGAGDLAWWQAHASVGADPLTVGGRFHALGEAMTEMEDPRTAATADGRIARRRMEFEVARRRARAQLTGRYYLRPFRRPAEDGTGAQGLTLVDLATGQRTDMVYAPLFAPVVDHGVDLPAVAVDGANRQLIVSGTATQPYTWMRVELGGETVPNSSVRAVGIVDLPFGEQSPTLAAIDAIYPPLADDVSSAAGPPEPIGPQSADVLLTQGGGASPELCVDIGIVAHQRPDVVEECLDQGIDLVSPLSNGDQALLQAADRNHLETVRLLIDAGADPNAAGASDPRRPIERATDPDLIVLIASRGGEARTAKEKKQAIKELLQLSGLRAPNGPWCFHYGQKGRTDVIEACLSKRNSGILTFVDPQAGHLLHVAAIAGRVEHVRMLLAAGASPNVPDADGKTPLGRLDELDDLDSGQAKAARLLELAGGL